MCAQVLIVKMVIGVLGSERQILMTKRREENSAWLAMGYSSSAQELQVGRKRCWERAVQSKMSTQDVLLGTTLNHNA